MSLINVEEDEDPWLLEYAAIERLTNQIQINITERNSQNSTAEYNKISARIRIQLKQFENEYIQLEKKLQVLGRARKITLDEKERRTRNLEILATKKVHLDSRFQNTPSSSSRNQLLETAKNKFFDDDDQPIIDNNVSVETFRAEQQVILRQQDDSLDTLSKVIARQKNIAIRIGNEVENQNDLIDNLADQIENTNTRVDSSTQHVQYVSDRDSTWSYWIVIISLFAAIIIVGIL